jgi:poly [ADP-ribose] polymerase
MQKLLDLLKTLTQKLFGKELPDTPAAPDGPLKATGKVICRYTLNYFDPDENSNKVWIGVAYDSGFFETRFGRVRDSASLASRVKKFGSRAGAEAELERKRSEKLRKGYKDTVVLDNQAAASLGQDRKQELSRIAAEQITGAAEDSVTAELVEYLVQVNIHHITQTTAIKYDASNATFSTPLGILTQDAISRARDLLNEIRFLNSSETEQDSRRRPGCIRNYFQLVPKDFGMRVPPSTELLVTEEQINAEVSILEALEAALRSAAPESDTQKLFQCGLVKIPHYTDDGRRLFREVRFLFETTRNSSHHPGTAKLKLTRLYEVEIEAMRAGFESAAVKLGNVRSDLWHGTRASNLLSILKHGLVIPPSNAAHCTGRMFGNGIYTSMQSTKALNYATDFWNRSGGSNQRVFMFLCDVALGKVHKPRNYTRTFPARGTDSTWVEPGKTGLLNHECIVYDTAQVNLRYLAEFGQK